MIYKIFLKFNNIYILNKYIKYIYLKYKYDKRIL